MQEQLTVDRRRHPVGLVYFIQATGGGPVKIGFAIDAQARLRGLQTGSPLTLEIVGTTPGSIADEQAWHERFAAVRLHGEWFTPTVELRHSIALACGRSPVAARGRVLTDERLPRYRPQHAKPKAIRGRYWPIARRLLPRLDGQRFVTSRQLSDQTGIPTLSVARVLSLLAQNGWLESKHMATYGSAKGWRRAAL